ncbi:HAD-IA family hydrolase [Lacticaseibacillus sharpeae]|uniref:p-ser-hpr phosphatase n=2 Tax=Lacticaseibacillus sharpeae TaxID=1626 RepID=A0A0R1ZM14_9LACO|nr:HAD-IA family hydrolase [Lacticaseibacillus sharpeae]KRM56088.1 p-ser-hpr phosphatase [Lacticaseibacillus sharpeae JCM 1186 = DSM 20505]
MATVIWDFDGTLYDTYPGMIRALVATLTAHNLPAEPHELLLATKYDSMKRVLDDAASQHHLDRQQLQSEYNAHELVLNQDPMPYPGALAALSTVHVEGATNLLWTHRDQKAWRLLRQHQMSGLFAGGTTIDMHFKRKPDPESINYLLTKFGAKPETTLVVGDRQLDVAAGKAAGCHTLYIDVDGLHDAAAEFTAPTLTAALPTIRQFVADQN